MSERNGTKGSSLQIRFHCFGLVSFQPFVPLVLLEAAALIDVITASLLLSSGKGQGASGAV